jgi:predicted DNA-binding transcriptional regulator AlpA
MIPFDQQAITAEQLALLFGCSPRHALERIACRPGFPERVSLKPAAWIAGEVLAWRDANRVGRQGHRPRPGSTAAGFVRRGAQ